MRSRLFPTLWLGVTLVCTWLTKGAELELRRIVPGTNTARASLRVFPDQRSPHRIPAFITGKFAEHLGHNIYNGMDAQILRNPTFADYPFGTGQMTPDGVAKFHIDEDKIKDELRRQATRFGWPESELASLVQARAEALACFWTRAGTAKGVQASPETGPHGGRAQRVQAAAAGEGVAQWTWLPLHRQRDYEFEVMIRSPDVQRFTVALWAQGSETAVSTSTVEGVASAWSKKTGKLRVPADLPADRAYKFTISADSPGQFVIRHAFLRPVDHMNGADPDVIKFLKDSHLPILRWPGGNFVSTYHWEDGVGPLERRLTAPNYAWGAIELNTFGTDEFVAFCRAVGCEPMICVNAGTGTPEEAARWVEYCNGPASSPMGRRRAENGHPEPFRIRHWEVGNELWGHWQMNWTTAQGYVDRFKNYATAMQAADPAIRLYSCGAPAMWGKEWNDTLIAGAGEAIGTVTDHPLIGGNVALSTEPLDVYRDFMAVPEVLAQKWGDLRAAMLQGGIQNPRLAVTELQLFAHLGGGGAGPIRLTRETLPSQAGITEAIYDILIYHAAIRLSPFVEMITHSATVNHGGGLRKERERVWANPCHYAQAAFAPFAGATPVAVELTTSLEQAPMVLPDLRHVSKGVSFGAIDVLAAMATDGAVLLSVVQRGSAQPVTLEVQIPGLKLAPEAKVETLTANMPWESNSLEEPDRIKPAVSSLAVRDGRMELTLRPFTVAQVRIPSVE